MRCNIYVDVWYYNDRKICCMIHFINVPYKIDCKFYILANNNGDNLNKVFTIGSFHIITSQQQITDYGHIIYFY